VRIWLAPWPLLLLVIDGCDALFGLDHVGPNHDAVIGATDAGFSCKDRASARFVCADFDDATEVVYTSGLAVPLPMMGSNVDVARRAPSVSPPNALWIDTSGGTYVAQINGTGSVHRLHGALDVDFSRFDADDATAFFVLGNRNGAFDHCYVQLGVETGPRLNVMSHCGSPDVNHYTDVLAQLPAGGTFVHLDFVVDTSTGTADAIVSGSTMVRLDLGFSSQQGGTAHVEFGVLDAIPAPGPRVAIDNIEVTVE